MSDNLSKIADQTRRITRIIHNLRAFARQEKTRTERVDLVDITRNALTLLESEIEASGRSPPPPGAVRESASWITVAKSGFATR